MKNFKMIMFASVIAMVALSNTWARDVYKIASSPYVGWEPWAYAADSGILKKWADKKGVEIEYQRINDYINSINLLTAGDFDAVTMTNMDALAFPAIGGVDVTALIVGDFSNGNDGVVAKGIKDLCELKGKTITLVELSVSHYLLARGLDEKCGMNERDVKVVNTADTQISSTFIAAADSAVVTWNPMLLAIRNEKGANLLFESSQIPGEIIDMLVVRTDLPDSVKEALVGAWYETMNVMTSRGKSGKEAIAYMAEVTGATVPEYNAQLRTTSMFYTAADANTFARSEELKTTMDHVRIFAFEHGLYAEGAPNADVVGIQYPDDSIVGDKSNVKLRFDATFMEAAANGKL